MGDFRVGKVGNSNSIRLTIIIRNLALLHGRDNGTWVLMPSAEHSGVLRDVLSNSTIELFASRIRLLKSDGTAYTSSSKTVFVDATEPRVPKMSDVLNQAVIVVPVFTSADQTADLSALSVQAFLPGGTITAYPAGGFPEHADIKGDLENARQIKLTDTVLYTLDLPPGTYQLKATSPRVSASFEFSTDARFELSNEDLRRRAVTSTDGAEEVKILRSLFVGNFGNFNSDEIWPCPVVKEGDFG